MSEHEIVPIDMVVSNLYPFAEVVSSGKGFDLCIENIDIGGPSMIRSAAKNHRAVSVVTSPSQYAEVRDEMRQLSGATSFEMRKRLASSAFQLTAEYDSCISSWFQERTS
jgi:phosphoribosylaminoimidazolecarboxamide formyltransferase/IMP cyclohydrolase